MKREPISSCGVDIVSHFYDGKLFKEREENLRVTSWPISLSFFSFMIARYILLRLKTINQRHFKCVTNPLVFYITEITTDNIKCFDYVIVTWYIYIYYKVQFHLKKVIKSFPRLSLEIFVWLWFSMQYIFSVSDDFLRIIKIALFLINLKLTPTSRPIWCVSYQLVKLNMWNKITKIYQNGLP